MVSQQPESRLWRLRKGRRRLLLGAAKSQQLMPERRVDESAVVRVGGARVSVPVEETTGEAHLDHRIAPGRCSRRIWLVTTYSSWRWPVSSRLPFSASSSEAQCSNSVACAQP